MQLGHELAGIVFVHLERSLSFALLPEAELGLGLPCLAGDVDLPKTGLTAILPVALVGAPIRPSVDSKAFLVFLMVLTEVLLLIGPGIFANSMAISVEPFARIHSSILPVIYSDAVWLVPEPLATIPALIRPFIHATSLLLSVIVLAHIGAFVFLHFGAMSVLQPRPYHSTVLTLDERQRPFATRHVISPTPIITLSFRPLKSPINRHPKVKYSFESSPIDPCHFTAPVSKTAIPLTLVGGLGGVGVFVGRGGAEGFAGFGAGEVGGKFGLVASEFLKLTDQFSDFGDSQAAADLLLNLDDFRRIRLVQLRMIGEKFFFQHGLA